MKLHAKIILILIAVIFVLQYAMSAFAECTPGQMTTLLKPITVFKKNEAGQKVTIELKSKTEVHVIDFDKNKHQIEVYVANNLNGERVNGLGQVNIRDTRLKCQVKHKVE